MFNVFLHSRARKFYDRLDTKHQRQINRALEAFGIIRSARAAMYISDLLADCKGREV